MWFVLHILAVPPMFFGLVGFLTAISIFQSLQQMGNSRARAVYEANLPDNFRRPQTDSPLEAFVRAKYEQKKYIAREWVPPTIPKVRTPSLSTTLYYCKSFFSTFLFMP